MIICIIALLAQVSAAEARLRKSDKVKLFYTTKKLAYFLSLVSS